MNIYMNGNVQSILLGKEKNKTNHNLATYITSYSDS